ncbi:MAG: nucleotidyltransferase family protein [Chloroflexi bacterium]|nr:nucleotidyltransferase family protein [Chloroflexota bacterium]MBM3154529.1 nucleotidyltransferase family protein [Chloroflexota bacterium]
MKGVILAAGLGTRLRPLTETLPKVMVPIGDRPLLAYHLDLFQKYGITEIAINLHHMPQKIINYLGTGEAFGVKVQYLYESELSGTAGAVKKLQDFLNETFIVFYGDNLTNLNIHCLADYHRTRSALVTIAVYEEPHPVDKGLVELDSGNHVRSFIEKPKVEEFAINLANAGIYVLEPEVLKYIPENQFCDFGADLFPELLQKGLLMYGYRIREYLLDIGTWGAYRQAQEDWREGKLK